jgi:hypothetical protein
VFWGLINTPFCVVKVLVLPISCREHLYSIYIFKELVYSRNSVLASCNFTSLYTVFNLAVVTMRMKPIPLAAYCKDFVPPVTGIGGRMAPVANTYDSSGNFAGRPRQGSLSKKRRIDEIDNIFDLSVPYPPQVFPEKPHLDLGEIKTLLVAATAAGEEVAPILDGPDIDPKIKAFGNLGMALLGLVAKIVENGIMPIAGGQTATAAAVGVATPKLGPPPPPKTSAGFRELQESLAKADTESILFDANLGNFALGNRNGLNSAFSAGIRQAAIENAEKKGLDPAESVRAMNDALDCVSEMDFVGLKSAKTKSRDPVTKAENSHFTMPIKFKFDDRNTRLHFERTIKAECGLRAVMSLPKPIREEQSLFLQAMRARYPDCAVTARPDIGSLHFIAFMKKATEKRWTRCSESVPIPCGIMLPDYKVRSAIVLPPAVNVQDAEQPMESGSASDSASGHGPDIQSLQPAQS